MFCWYDKPITPNWELIVLPHRIFPVYSASLWLLIQHVQHSDNIENTAVSEQARRSPPIFLVKISQPRDATRWGPADEARCRRPPPTPDSRVARARFTAPRRTSSVAGRPVGAETGRWSSGRVGGTYSHGPTHHRQCVAFASCNPLVLGRKKLVCMNFDHNPGQHATNPFILLNLLFFEGPFSSNLDSVEQHPQRKAWRRISSLFFFHSPGTK